MLKQKYLWTLHRHSGLHRSTNGEKQDRSWTDLDVTRGLLKYALMKSTFSVRPMNWRRLTRDTSGTIISWIFNWPSNHPNHDLHQKQPSKLNVGITQFGSLYRQLLNSSWRMCKNKKLANLFLYLNTTTKLHT